MIREYTEYAGIIEDKMAEYDVVLKNGKEYLNVFPNNGKLTVLTGPDAGKDIPDIFVVKIRTAKNPTE